eukprot:6460639-Amphidinium_carterae.1
MQSWAGNHPLHMQPMRKLDVPWLLTSWTRDLGPPPCEWQYPSTASAVHLESSLPVWIDNPAHIVPPTRAGWKVRLPGQRPRAVPSSRCPALVAEGHQPKEKEERTLTSRPSD